MLHSGLLTALALLAASPAGASAASGADTLPLVVLDAGHGGTKSGAVGACGILEKDVSLAIVLELEKLLVASGRVRVLLTRHGDETVELEDRARIANEARADLFLSVHGNAATTPASHGVETYFVSRAAADRRIEELAIVENEGVLDRGTDRTLERILDSLRVQASEAESQRFASLVQESACLKLGDTSRGVMQAPFFVLRQVDMPSVLVEVGFLSNPDECRRMGDPEHQRALAQALGAAVLAHLWTTSAPLLGSVRP